MSTTYSDLYTLVNNEIQKNLAFGNNPLTGKSATTKTQVIGGGIGTTPANAIVDTSAIMNSIMDLMMHTIPPQIKSGLHVKQTEPATNKVTITAGEGTVGARIFKLNLDTTYEIPFDRATSIWYINFGTDGINMSKTPIFGKLTIAKIVVPKPGVTSFIRDDKDVNNNPWDAWIVNYQEYKLFGNNAGKFEEDTKELLRDNIGDILADNLIGNIRLSEDLKITNTQGSVEIDSQAINIYDLNDSKMAVFNKYGTFFYNENGIELAKFSVDGARVGNIEITKNSLQSQAFTSDLTGFQIKDSGEAEFNEITVRGTIYAQSGNIGGFTITDSMLYADGSGVIQTGANVGAGQNGVRLDEDGLHVYDAVLGRIVYFPSDGNLPEIGSGTMTEVVYELSTNAVIRTSSTVGDGSASSSGILINNTGLYGCEDDQLLADANLKALIDGTISISGEINSTSGNIGGVTITDNTLSGGEINGATIIGASISNSSNLPRITFDSDGISYQETSIVGTYGTSGSGLSGFQYGGGTFYGTGLQAALFNQSLPVLSVLAERDLADIRLYDRGADPIAGTHHTGDLICVNGKLKICTTNGTPGTFTVVGTQS